ncbi:SRPBCC domain-containing protein [Phenylobacterium sp.]|uniref:SRPBCC domain-containing protein n=1 Tax=Phenylobacterium sp. TaxID=1871053 RepID=UPI002E30FDCD|nr:SRPBCC domain-containing protein [Phenylobacterium sp.]HEX2560509.1 SRPBCC domain-containing protein [Phenylobacterium sp.]
MPIVRTEALIPAPPDEVWAVLADFDRYEAWNPLNIRARGEARLGAKVRMTFLNLARPGTTIDQTVTVTTCVPGKALAWSGWVPLLFNGRHHFTLEQAAEGTRLMHGEDFGGLITLGFTPERLARDFTPAYEGLNAALAARVAGLSRGG